MTIDFPGRTILGGVTEFRVDVALPPVRAAVDVWDTARWDTGVWSGSDPAWLPVSSDVLEVNVTRGRERWADRFGIGSVSVTVDNTQGRYNPIGGASLPGSQVKFRPGRWIRVAGRVNTPTGPGPWEQLIVARIESITDRYDAGGYGIVTDIYAVDLLAKLAQDHPPELSTPRAAESISDRLDFVFTTSNVWKWALQTIGVNLQPTTFPSDRLTEAHIAVGTTNGALFNDRDGVAQGKNRFWLRDDPRSSAPQLVAGGDDVGVVAIDADWNLGVVYNDIRFSRRGGAGVEQRREDTASQAKYGRRTLIRSDFDSNNDNPPDQVADIVLRASHQDRLQVLGAGLEPLTPAGAQSMLETELGDMVVVAVETGGGDGWAWWAPTHVQAISHRITADDWAMTVRVDDSALAGLPDPVLPAPTIAGVWTLADRLVAPGGITRTGAPTERLTVAYVDADGTDHQAELVAAVGSYCVVSLPSGTADGWSEYRIDAVRAVGPDWVAFDVTWQRSTPGNLANGDRVNVQFAPTPTTT